MKVQTHMSFGNVLSSSVKYFKKENDSLSNSIFIGELNEKNRKNGRGISISFDGFISLANYDDGLIAPGKFIHIYVQREHYFEAGEIYEDSDKKIKSRHTRYEIGDTTGCCKLFW